MFFQNINDSHCSGPASPFHQDFFFIKCHSEQVNLPAKNLHKWFVSPIILQFLEQVCLVATGFVHASSMLLWLTSHSQHSCTSQEATAGCSPHPHLAAPLTDTQRCKERTTPQIPLLAVNTCQKMDQKRVPKEPSASKRSAQSTGKNLRHPVTWTSGIIKKTIIPQFDTDNKHLSYIWAAHRKRWAQSRTRSQLRKWPELWQNSFQGSGELV